MCKKKKLAQAVVLGLLASSMVVGNVYAQITEYAIDTIKTLPSDKGSYSADNSVNQFTKVLMSLAENNNAGIILDTTKNIELNATGIGRGAFGIESSLSNNAQAGYTSKVNLNTTENILIKATSDTSEADGIIIKGGADVTLHALGEIKLNVSSDSDLGTGITAAAANGASNVILSSSNNTIEASYAGIDAYTHDAKVSLIASSDENGKGNNVIKAKTAGILAWPMYVPEKGDGQVDMTASNDNIVITEGYGVYSEGKLAKVTMNAGHDNSITFSDYKGINALEGSSTTLEADNDNVITGKGTSIYSKGSKVIVTANDGGNTIVSSEGVAIKAEDNSTVDIVAEKGENSIVGTSNTIIANGEGTEVNVKGKQNVINSDDKAIQATDNANVTIDGDNTQVTGNILVLNTAIATVNFNDSASLLDGIVTTGNDNAGTTSDLTFVDNATWNMKDVSGTNANGTSNVTNLTLNDGIVDMTADGVGGTKLTVENLKGSGGTFKMDLAYIDNDVKSYSADDSISDFLTVTGSAEGAQKLVFTANDKNIGAMDSDEVGDKLYFATIAGQQANSFFDSATITDVNKENVYNYKYLIQSEENGDDTDFFITNSKKSDPGTNVDVTRDSMLADYALATEMDRLNKRLGESRYFEDEKGLYVRYRHNHLGYDNAFKTKGNMFQLGYDKERIEQDGKHYRGGAIDYTHGSTSFNNVPGHGEHDRYGISFYDTWIGEKGHYHDLVIRGGQLHSGFDVYNENNDKIHARYHRNFLGISGEYGRKIEGKDGWYVEPQAQLQLTRVMSSDFSTNYGVHVEQDGTNSAIGRAGFRLGRLYQNEDGNKRNNYYLKADVMHEFAGDQAFTVIGKDGVYRGTDTHDTWYDIGVGCDIKIKENRYFWLDLERSFGSNYDTTWQVNGGFRWEF